MDPPWGVVAVGGSRHCLDRVHVWCVVGLLVVCLQWMVEAQLMPGSADLVALTDLTQLPLGVDVRTGICEDRPAWLDSQGAPMFPGPDTAWHRLSLSVKGNSVTLVKDCAVRGTEAIDRSDEAVIDHSGIILIGQKFYDDEVYQVRRDNHLVR
ncbi:unnamed protein product, partial [Ixodes pacificus]